MGQQVATEWFDSFNRECEREERELLRDWGCPIDEWHNTLDNRIVVLVGYQEKEPKAHEL